MLESVIAMRSVGRAFTSSGVRLHPTAIVAPSAQLGVDVEVGPYAIVEAHACIGDRTRLLASAFVAGSRAIGADCEVHMGAILGGTAQIRGKDGADGGLDIGARNVIREHVTIHRGQRPGASTTVGSDNFLLAGCHIAHDCRVGNGTTIANGALLAGCVTLGDGAFISGNVVVHQHVKIGALSMIGGQARVSKDVLPFVLVVGDSEVRGLNVIGMRRAGMSAARRQRVRRAYAVLYRSGLNVAQAVARLRELPANREVAAWLAFIEDSTRGLCAARRRVRAPLE